MPKQKNKEIVAVKLDKSQLKIVLSALLSYSTHKEGFEGYQAKKIGKYILNTYVKKGE